MAVRFACPKYLNPTPKISDPELTLATDTRESIDKYACMSTQLIVIFGPAQIADVVIQLVGKQLS